MSIEEIDRLHKFRETNNYVNSSLEFQQVTQVSNQWLDKYSPYFKFPKWVNNNKPTSSYISSKAVIQQEEIVVKCINSANEEDLRKVRGIGATYAERIIKEREKLGGYLAIEQVKFIYGLPEETFNEFVKYFIVEIKPVIVLLNINESNINEIKELPYLNYYIAREIVKYRSMNGDIVNKEQFRQIEKFPLDKIDIISLYLKFTN
ncbi:helix-hairpin-helix domain-containing protein [Myroides injenensis]|uniref:helix-hairpin-helix domain-containing protein n=1 Tax=Myroides injenensis TaxID=1183151 RepID=UPI0002F09B45|nr:helix-hairpin-helix domain-containing protein [Myroides injenensis]